MKHTYETQGTCSRLISFELEGSRVKNVSFMGGCNGNLKGICALAQGQDARELIAKLKGIECGAKGTSCPDQFARALEEALEGERGE